MKYGRVVDCGQQVLEIKISNKIKKEEEDVEE